MSIERVKAYFSSYGIEDRIQELDQSSATAELAAKALGCEPARIAKTLSFLVDGKPVLIVAAGDAKVANPKFKQQFFSKASMIKADQVENLVGHAVGGVCPFGVKPGVQIYLDDSLKRFQTVYPACGSSNSAIEMDLQELETYSQALGWVDVCKGWQ